jgi:dihydrofolate synthase/folylpolyglutamate synthase
MEILNIDLHNLGIIDESMEYSHRNKLLAAFTFEYFKNQFVPKSLNISKYSFQSLKGRFEELKFGPITFIFVGSHNIDGVRKLMQKISLGKQDFDAALLSFSKRPDQEIETILGIFLGSFKKVMVTSFEHIKAATQLKDQADKNKVEFVTDWKTYLESKIKNQDKPETILVSGSYYFVGEVQKFLFSFSDISAPGIRPSQDSANPG